MGIHVDAFFNALSGIQTPVLTDISKGLRRSVRGLDLDQQLNKSAAWLKQHGAQERSYIIALIDNTLESAMLLLTAMRHGIAIVVQPIGTTHSALVALADRIRADAIIDGTGSTEDFGIPKYQLELLDNLVPVPAPQLCEETPFLVTFTSGSTGQPKGIVHAARSLISCSASFNKQTGIADNDIFLNVMPMYYMAGIFNGIIAPLERGASVVIDAGFGVPTAMALWRTIETNSISALWLSPTMLSLVVRLDRTAKVLPPTLRHLFVGTGAMAEQDARSFVDIYGLPPQQSYGLSELLYISVDDANSPAFGSVGKPLDTVDVKFDDSGTILIETEHSFLGYLEEGVLVPADVPFRTTDIGRRSEDGTLYIEGRSDDVIVRGGLNVNPLVIEAALQKTLTGRRFCVSSKQDGTLGNRVVLVLEATFPGDEELFQRAQREVSSRFERMNIDTMINVETIPVGPTGKIQRSAVRSMVAQS